MFSDDHLDGVGDQVDEREELSCGHYVGNDTVVLRAIVPFQIPGVFRVGAT